MRPVVAAAAHRAVATALLLLLLPPPSAAQGPASCASHHQETQPCCGQIPRDPGCATGSCTVDAAHRCAAALPVCTNYVYNRYCSPTGTTTAHVTEPD